MVSINTVRQLLPPYRNERVIVTYDQSTNDIIKDVLSTHERYESDYDKIYALFDTGDIYTTASGLWNFCKYNLRYVVESENDQSVKSPSAIVQPGETVDCKHYSLFIGGVLDAIKQNEGEDWNWCYRFASYDNSRHVEHVFVVVKEPGGKEIWIDPVLKSFDERYKPTYYKDKQPMALVRISGIIGDAGQTVTVDKTAAENNFLAMVNLNLFGLKSILKSDPVILNTRVKTYFAQNGYDFSRLQNILKY